MHTRHRARSTRVCARTHVHTHAERAPAPAHQRPDYCVPFAVWPRLSERSEGLSHTPVWRPQLPTHLVLSASFTVFPRIFRFGCRAGFERRKNCKITAQRADGACTRPGAPSSQTLSSQGPSLTRTKEGKWCKMNRQAGCEDGTEPGAWRPGTSGSSRRRAGVPGGADSGDTLLSGQVTLSCLFIIIIKRNAGSQARST